MNDRIVISIINYRTGDLTLQCVQSVLDDLGDIQGHIVVVDNNSNDGSSETIQNWINDHALPVPVTLVQSLTNGGFSAGHNLGIAARNADFYLLLNSDALLRPGFIKSILIAAESNPKAGLFAPQLQGGDGRKQSSCFRFHSPFSELMRSANSGPVTKLLKSREVSLGPDPELSQIEWTSFACVLLSAKMIAEVGPMDEGYFLYYEDSEYCLRARRNGWPILYVPEAIAIHYRGGSGPVKSLSKSKKRLPDYYYKSRSRFFRQAHGWSGLLSANLLWHVGRGLAQLRRIIGKEIPTMNVSEAQDIWIGFSSPLARFQASGD